METLFSEDKERIVESLIKESRTGRNSSFEALDFLEKRGFIELTKVGNQKKVILVKDNFSFQFKYYLDSIRVKELKGFLQLLINLLNLELSKVSKFKYGVLFGSVLTNKSFNDIDILLVGDGLKISDLKTLDKMRKMIERFFGVILNFHLGSSNFEEVSRGIVFYQSSYILELSNIQKQYLEFFDSFCEGIFNKNDRSLFEISLLNLAYVFCSLNNFHPKSKKEAGNYFYKKYKIKTFSELNK
ncbi:MAG: hypothetical protein PHY83_06120, partial [Bacilli bacterium]|nr:hypothetical protein [Bacilli bacterium]